ncbi:MAG: hypothetical protein A4E64_01159 [Syntrophorhabdus sp. PtaU1.Bin058]|nr:MAG: hypothetical protein A4E64_01159 [Syntrophorhabdus sp. PtaU1.Bin058]
MEPSPGYQHQVEDINLLMHHRRYDLPVFLREFFHPKDQPLKITAVQRCLKEERSGIIVIDLKGLLHVLPEESILREEPDKAFREFHLCQPPGIKRQLPGEGYEVFVELPDEDLCQKCTDQHLQIFHLESDKRPIDEIDSRA